MKNIVTFCFLFVMSIGSFSQEIDSKSLKEANEYFNDYLYNEAIRKYELSNDTTVQTYRNLGISYWKTGDVVQAKKCFEKVVSSTEASDKDMLHYAEILRENKNYEASELWIRKVYEINASDSRIQGYMADLGSHYRLQKDDGQFSLENLDVNSEHQDFGAIDYKDKVVFVSSREKVQLIYRRWNPNQLPYLDVYIADSLNTQILNPREISSKVNKRFHEGPVTFSPDGNEMIFTRNNYKRDGANKVVRLQLYKTILRDGEWQKPEQLPFNSPDFSCGHASYGPDGKYLYFVSDMPGGIGGTDLYKVEINEDGTFGNPVNLGPEVNTEGNEMFPYIHPSNELLFFSSNGRVGLGGLDVFVAEVDANGELSSTMNLGAPVNSSRDDFSFVLDADQKKGYMASNREGGRGGDDIYGVEIMKPLEFEVQPTFDCPIYANPEMTIELDISESIDMNSNDYEYVWAFEDGEIMRGTKVKKTFRYPGTYEVKVGAFDKITGKIEKAEIVNVLDLDEINYIGYTHKNDYKLNEIGVFDASVSRMEDVTFNDYYWKVNDLVLENRTERLEFLFGTEGSYEISLQVNGTDVDNKKVSYCYKHTFNIIPDTTVEDLFADNTFESNEEFNTEIENFINEQKLQEEHDEMNTDMADRLESYIQEVLIMEDSEVEILSVVEVFAVEIEGDRYLVSGNVSDDLGAPVSNLRFNVMSGTVSSLKMIDTDENGDFTLVFTSDEYEDLSHQLEEKEIVENLIKEESRADLIDEITENIVVEDEADTDVQMTIENISSQDDGSVITGRFTDENGQALSNTTFDLLDDDGKLIETVVTDENGNFTLDMSNDELVDNFTTEAEEFVVLKEVSNDQFSNNVVVEEAPGEDVVVSIRNAQTNGENALVNGVLTDEEGNVMPNQEFDLLDDDGKLIETVVTDENGNFTLDMSNDELVDNFTPTEEEFVVLKEVSNDQFSNNVVVEGAPEEDIVVSIRNAQTNGENALVNGVLTDEEGNVMPNQEFDLLDDDGKLIETVVTDENGSFTLDMSNEELVDNFTPTEEEITVNNKLTNEISEKVVLANSPETLTNVLVNNVKNKDDKSVISGILTDDEGEPLANTTFQLLDDKGEVLEEITTGKNGDFKVSLTTENLVNNFDIEKDQLNREDDLAIADEPNHSPDLNSGLSPVNSNGNSGTIGEITIIPIYFDFDKYSIREDEVSGLDELVDMMNENPEMEIEITGHTDSRGESEYNQYLSDKRAQAVVDYIKKRISNPGRVSGKGFGETDLVNDCGDGVECSESQHQKNRRVEFIVVSR